jgi:hypothetical protein
MEEGCSPLVELGQGQFEIKIDPINGSVLLLIVLLDILLRNTKPRSRLIKHPFSLHIQAQKRQIHSLHTLIKALGDCLLFEQAADLVHPDMVVSPVVPQQGCDVLVESVLGQGFFPGGLGGYLSD